MRALVVIACGLVLSIALADASGAPRATELQRATLTKDGEMLWNFESLLRTSFPDRKVVSASVAQQTGALDFVCGGSCAPNARYSSYAYSFARRRASEYHLAQRTFSGSWGNYRRQVLIRGRSVACNAKETAFLVQQRQAVSFKLECAAPPA